FDREADAVDADGHAGFPEDFFLRAALRKQLHGPFRVGAEYFRQLLHLDDRHATPPSSLLLFPVRSLAMSKSSLRVRMRGVNSSYSLFRMYSKNFTYNTSGMLCHAPDFVRDSRFTYIRRFLTMNVT